MANRIHKVGVVGCGFIANQKHFPALAKLPDRVELVAFCDIRPERAQQAAAQYGAPTARACTDYRELVENREIDLLYVLTPNRTHAEITIGGLKAGKDVMCEKPMACSSQEAQAMLEAAKESGKKLTIGYQYRCGKDPQQLKKIVESGQLGEIYFAQAHAYRRRGVPNWGVFLDEEQQGGGALIDIGTHALDMTLWLMDNYSPKAVLGTTYRKLGTVSDAGNKFGGWDTENFHVEESAFGFLVMENSATITLGASWALNTMDTREQKVTLCGTKAGADMDDGLRINGVAQEALYDTRPQLIYGSNPNHPYNPTEADLDARYWLDALDNDAPLFVKPEQALVVTRILEAIYQSSLSGQAVYF